MDYTLMREAAKARRRAAMPLPWEVGPLAAILGEATTQRLEPLNYSMNFQETVPAPVTPPLPEPAQGQPRVSGKRKREGLAPEKEDEHKRSQALDKWMEILGRVGRYSELRRTVDDEDGNWKDTVADVLSTRAEATLRSRAWPLIQYEKWCVRRGLVAYPFTEKQHYDYVKDLAVSKKAASRAGCFIKSVKFIGYLFGVQGAVDFKSPRVQGAAWKPLTRAKLRVGREPFIG